MEEIEMGKKIVNEVNEVLNAATPEEVKTTESISQEAETKVKEQLKKDAKAKKSSGGLRL